MLIRYAQSCPLFDLLNLYSEFINIMASPHYKELLLTCLYNQYLCVYVYTEVTQTDVFQQHMNIIMYQKQKRKSSCEKLIITKYNSKIYIHIRSVPLTKQTL